MRKATWMKMVWVVGLVVALVWPAITGKKVDFPLGEVESLMTESENVSPTLTPVATEIPGTAVVERVIDGDTIVISGGARVRYIGVDTPELAQDECFAAAAKAKNEELVMGKTVKLIKDVSDTDRFGRLLRYVWVEDTFVNLELVRLGFAKSASYPPDIARQQEFLQAEREAFEHQVGLWSGCLTGQE